jgi:hypothetical protein
MDIVGTSRSVGDLFGHPRMQAFLEEQNKEVAVLPKGRLLMMSSCSSSVSCVSKK